MTDIERTEALAQAILDGYVVDHPIYQCDATRRVEVRAVELLMDAQSSLNSCDQLAQRGLYAAARPYAEQAWEEIRRACQVLERIVS